MFVTDQFVVLHLPKTGSTFIRETLKQLYLNNSNIFNEFLYKFRVKKRPYKELLFQKVEMNELYAPMVRNRFTPHGIYYQIPKEHKNKAVVSVVRNPFERLVSFYEFKSWSSFHPKPVLDEIYKKWPKFPELSFSEFFDFYFQFGATSFCYEQKCKSDIGPQTKQFFWFFMRDPFQEIPKVNDKYILEKRYKKALANIHFLKTENLNNDLYQLLLDHGVSEKKVKFVLQVHKINQTKKTNSIRDYFTNDQIEQVLHKERVLFDLFPEFKFDFE